VLWLNCNVHWEVIKQHIAHAACSSLFALSTRIDRNVRTITSMVDNVFSFRRPMHTSLSPRAVGYDVGLFANNNGSGQVGATFPFPSIQTVYTFNIDDGDGCPSVLAIGTSQAMHIARCGGALLHSQRLCTVVCFSNAARAY
jgi:hypothetical protein